MLESIRKHQKLLQWLLLLLIFPSFAFFGIESYMRNAGGNSDLVKVDGHAITFQELDRAVKVKADRLQQQGQVDAAFVNSVPFKQAVLGELIQQRLLAYELTSLRLAVGKDALAKDLMQIPEVRSLFKADGSFDSQKYKQLLANNGMSVDQFENGRRYDLMSRQALTAVLASGVSSRKVAEQVALAYEAEREVQVLRFNGSDFVSKVTPTEQQIEAFYQSNLAAYQMPESIDLEYVMLVADPKGDAKQFAERADLFANLAYEQPDSLKPIADRLKLAIQSVKGVNRAGAKALAADHPLNNKKLMAALFADDAVKNRRNTEAVEISPGRIVVARVTGHQAQQALPLATVASDVKRQVSNRMAQDMAVKAGQERLEAIKKNSSDVSGFSSAKWVSRNKPTDLTPEAMDAVVAVDVGQMPSVVGVNTPTGFALYRVNKTQKPSSSDAKLRMGQIQQVAQLSSQAEAAAYFDGVRARAGVKQINPVK